MGGQLKSGAQTDKATGIKGLQTRVYTWTALGGSTPNNQQFCKSYSQKTDNSSTDSVQPQNPEHQDRNPGTEEDRAYHETRASYLQKTSIRAEQQCKIIITKLIKVINTNINIRQLPRSHRKPEKLNEDKPGLIYIYTTQAGEQDPTA